jgi:phage tail-like protein
MAQFTVNATRFDPYKNFKFKVKYNGHYVCGVSKMSPLKRTTQVITHRDGGDPSSHRRMPGRSDYDAITLERGLTHDAEFEEWAAKVWALRNGSATEVSLKDFRRDITIEVYNEAGQLALAYHVFDCWVAEFTTLGEMDANGNGVAIQSIKLEHHGWLRDSTVPEPAERSFTP